MPAPAGDDEGLATGRYRERPIAFGPDGRLFGMVTRPASASPIESAVIFLSTGAGHQVGPHRLYVPLAREWASRGHLVLRFDLGGIGDSVAASERDAGEAYPARMHEDVRDAIAMTRRLAPRARVVLAGLCSGGWLAFDAARRGFDVDGIVAINPPLYLRDGNREWVRQQRRFDRYQQAARDPVKWVQVLRRRASAAQAVREVTRRLHQAARERVRAIVGRSEADGLSRDLRTIAGRGVRTLLVFSDGDNGLRYFEQHAPPAQRRVEVRAVVRHVVVQGAGHAFQPTAAQRVLRALLDDFVAAP
jgi:dienelactone hydrolase